MMNPVTRVLVMGGLGLAAALTVGAGPAQAVSAAGQTGQMGAHVSVKGDWNDGDIVGYYGSLRRCDRAGERGEDRGRWDDYDCYRVRYGLHRGDWALNVYYDDDWDNGDDAWQGPGLFPSGPFSRSN